MRILCMIAARAGSKGLSHKNIAKLNGEPLLVRALRLAKRVASLGEHCHWKLVVSTDSKDYADLAQAHGADPKFPLRPAHLATDQSSLRSVIRHTLTLPYTQNYKPDLIVLLSSTHPFLGEHSVGNGIQRAIDSASTVPCTRSVVSIAIDPIAASWRCQQAADGTLTQPAPGTITQRPRYTTPTQAPTYMCGAFMVASPQHLKRNGGQFFLNGQTSGLLVTKREAFCIEDAEDLQWATLLSH